MSLIYPLPPHFTHSCSSYAVHLCVCAVSGTLLRRYSHSERPGEFHKVKFAPRSSREENNKAAKEQTISARLAQSHFKTGLDWEQRCNSIFYSVCFQWGNAVTYGRQCVATLQCHLLLFSSPSSITYVFGENRCSPSCSHLVSSLWGSRVLYLEWRENVWTEFTT